MSNPSPGRINPYVGPRAFRTGETLHGRDPEVFDLDNLLVAERIVLMYSPSGAGKTSLIQAALIPQLESEGFKVLPVMRVNLEPPPTPEFSGPVNRYILSLLLSLEENPESTQPQLSLNELAKMTLADYLDQRDSQSGDADSEVLILDQFEEILTIDPTDVAGKTTFFSQLGQALRKHHRWALFAMREEFLAGLDPYLRLLPTRLATTFRLDLLRVEEARLAMQMPARRVDTAFTDDAARMLTDDLRRVWVQRPDGSRDQQLGPYVEPVQLQVVCYRLWEKLPADDFEIGEDDVQALGDVDSALADYYNERVVAIAAETGEKERHIREWFDRHLITAQGIRGLIQKGPGQTKGLDNRIVSLLVNAHLVRAEERRGLILFELSHDRLIEPVQTINAVWREANLSPFQRQAALWEAEGRPSHLLLHADMLVNAEKWAGEHREELTPAESAFLNACRERGAAKEKEFRLAARVRRLKTAVLLIAGLLFAFVSYNYYSIWVKNRPWGYLSNLSAGTFHQLEGNVVSIGRSTSDFRNQISLWPRFVSRIHLFISKQLWTAVDMRSLNGTTVNGDFLIYGDSKDLEDDDIIVLADIAPFRFQSIKYFPLQLWVPSIKASTSPSGWGMLIDHASKKLHYLDADTSFIAIDGENNLILQVNQTNDSVLTIRRSLQGGWSFEGRRDQIETADRFTVEDHDDEKELWAIMKTGDYTIRACYVAPGQEYDYFDSSGSQCQRIYGRDDYKEPERHGHAVFQTIFFYSKNIKFRIIPIVPNLISKDAPERTPSQ